MERLRRFLAAAVIALAVAGAGRADTIWLVKANGPADIDRGVSKIIGVAGNDLVARTVAGGEKKVPLAMVARLQIDGEDTFNEAEDLFSREKYDDATMKYRLVVDGKGRDWVRNYSVKRLLDAAGRAGRFDEAVGAFIVLSGTNAAAAQAARPAVPTGANSARLLADAVAKLTAATQQVSATPEQKTAILLFVVDIQRARNDTAGRLAALVELQKVNPGALPPGVGAEIAIGQAEVALAKGSFAAAIKAIDDAGRLITDPPQQVEALYLRAEGRLGMANAEADAARKKELLLDAAVDYTRLVTVARDARAASAQPRAVAALLRLGEIHEQIAEPATARKLYESILREYAAAPAAAEARRRLAKLPAAAPATRP